MDYKDYLNSQVLVGYSKSDLERLIGLPKNFLSGFLSGKKNLGIKNKLRVLNWSMVDSKPTPLEVDNYLKKVANKKLGLVIFTEPTPTSFDAEKIDKIKHDEVGKWKELKTEGVPPIPIKQEGEHYLDFSARKNEWKLKYNQ